MAMVNLFKCPATMGTAPVIDSGAGVADISSSEIAMLTLQCPECPSYKERSCEGPIIEEQDIETSTALLEEVGQCAQNHESCAQESPARGGFDIAAYLSRSVSNKPKALTYRRNRSAKTTFIEAHLVRMPEWARAIDPQVLWEGVV